MRKLLFFLCSILLVQVSNSQDIQIRVRQVSYNPADPDGAGPATGQVTFAFDLKSTGADVLADGMGLIAVYQSALLMPTPTNTTSKRGPINTALWTQNVDHRAGNTISPTVSYGGQSFDRRMVINFQQGSGTPDALISGANWTEVAWVTYYTLGTANPFGGYLTAEPASIVAQNELSSNGGELTFPYLSPNLNTPVALGPSASPLPVEFTRFNADCSGAGTTIAWSTATEKNNSHYEVEKSLDGTSWTSLGQVMAGSGTSAKSYRFTDKAGGAALYRVKQVDMDGAISYTDIVRTSCNSKAFFVNLYPVPARDKLTVVIGSDKSIRTTLQVMDNYGRTVMSVPVTITKGLNNFALPIGHLAQGQYYLKGSGESVSVNERFTISR